jgi:hypothetical protein
VPHIIENKRAAPFDNAERLVHLEVSMNRDTHTDRYLLGSHCQTIEAPAGVCIDEDISST